MLCRVGLVMVIAACAVTSACACEATKAAYDKIKPKMTLRQVEAIVGCSGTSVQESESGNITIAVYLWSGGSAGSSLVTYLMNGKLTNKAQNALR